MKPHLLIIPGLGDSDQNHWQSFWLRKFGNSSKVVQRNWQQPQLEDWLETLNLAIEKTSGPTILVAHSLAVSLVLHWLTKHHNPNIVGAMLVAPADVNSPQHTPDFLRHFAPIPTQRIHIPSLVVGSENDHYMSLKRAQELANCWGSEFINSGNMGHINSETGLLYWEEGQTYLERLINKISL